MCILQPSLPGTYVPDLTKACMKTYQVDFKYKSSFIDAYHEYFYWQCFSGYCGNEAEHTLTHIENRTSYPSSWHQDEGYIKRHINSDKPFLLWETSCCWVYNMYSAGGWQLLTAVDLGLRSDTKKPNTSPVTTIIPIIRIPQNCATSIKLLAHDPDGDRVRCRNGYEYGECGLCAWYFALDEGNCIISVPSGKTPGLYTMELVLEDFPEKDIYLTYNDGTVSYKFRTFQHREARDTYQYWSTTGIYGTNSYDTTEEPVTSRTEEPVTHFVTKLPETTTAQSHETFTEDHHSVRATTADVFTSSLPQQSTESYTFSTIEETTITTTDDHFTAPSSDSQTTALYTSERITVTEVMSSGTNFPYNTNSLSRIPLQFLVEVTAAAPSCTLGQYRPEFLYPTPMHGEKLEGHVGKTFQLHLSARAAYESIIDFKVSGPSGMTKSSLGKPNSITRTIIVEWTPKKDNAGEHVAVCFVAETNKGSQSELRCVIIVVEHWSIDIFCHENTMTIIVSKSSDNVLSNKQFRLNDPKCLVSSNSTHLIASVGYNYCGTVTEETEESIVFKNEISSYDDISVVITREHVVSIPFNCSFPKKNRVSASFHTERKIYVFTEAGFGNFTYEFNFFKDNRFVDLRSENLFDVKLKELLFMQVQVSSSVPNVQLFVESCKATPHDNPSDPIFYDIIKNGCIQDNTVVVYPAPNKNTYRFSMEAFAFIGDYEEVYISCATLLCKTGASNTRCTQGCISGSHRRKRSLASESQQHFISQGPIGMKKETPGDTGVKNISGVNGNTLVIAISGMVAVALISITLNIYIKRTRAAGYQRLNTQDL